MKKSGGTVNYIGSKTKLIPFLRETIKGVVGKDLSKKSLCDLFAGSGVVGRAFKDEVDFIISNDIEYYSYVLNYNALLGKTIHHSCDYIETLNELKPLEGLIYQHYCEGSGCGRVYFSDLNGQKIDALRQAIESYKEDKNLYYFLLASLLKSADKVANTASVYSSFLKTLKPLACKEMVLEGLDFEPDEKSHQVFCEDANTLISKIKGDILYLDPPYNHRQYGANYHLLNTIAFYDVFEPQGKTGVRNYISSPYCKRGSAFSALEALIREAKFRYIFLSYNDEGLISQSDIAQIMRRYGRYEPQSIPHQRFKAYDNKQCKNFTREYLHILEKF